MDQKNKTELELELKLEELNRKTDLRLTILEAKIDGLQDILNSLFCFQVSDYLYCKSAFSEYLRQCRICNHNLDHLICEMYKGKIKDILKVIEDKYKK